MKWLRGRRKWLVLSLLAVGLAVALPFHIAGSGTRDRAVLRGLERRYGEGREHGPVYIEGGRQVLAGVTALGKQPVEVVSRGELTTRYAGKTVAPELTTVTVEECHDLLGVRYTVTVSSFGFRVPGATSFPWGGTHVYHFRQWSGLLWADGEDFLAH